MNRNIGLIIIIIQIFGLVIIELQICSLTLEIQNHSSIRDSITEGKTATIKRRKILALEIEISHKIKR